VEVSVPHRSLSVVVPFAAMAVGFLLSVWRFRLDDSLGGLIYGYGGIVLLVVLACWMARSEERPADERPAAHAVATRGAVSASSRPERT
jgi:hypothetical protein